MSGAGVVHYHLLHRPRSVPTALGPAPLVTEIVLSSKKVMTSYMSKYQGNFDVSVHDRLNNLGPYYTNKSLKKSNDEWGMKTNKKTPKTQNILLYILTLWDLR